MVTGRNKKRIISVLVAFVLLLSSFPCAYAEEVVNGSDCSNPRSTTLGYITSPTGERETVVGRIVNVTRPQPYSVGRSGGSLTYECNLYTDGYTLQAVQKNNTITGSDAYNCTTVTLTIYFFEDTSVSPTMYLLYGVSGGWSWTQYCEVTAIGTVSYGCTGPGYYNSVTQSGETVVRGNFNVNTNFGEYIESTYGSVMGATLDIDYRMIDGSTWSYTLTNNYFNNPFV